MRVSKNGNDDGWESDFQGGRMYKVDVRVSSKGKGVGAKKGLGTNEYDNESVCDGDVDEHGKGIDKGKGICDHIREQKNGNDDGKEREYKDRGRYEGELEGNNYHDNRNKG